MMNEWTIFLALGEIIALVLCLAKPMTELTKSITSLKCAIEETQNRLQKNEQSSTIEHGKIWSEVEEHRDKIADHETRIGILEHDK